ncbi:UNVERIFIED_CONTAM: hypothetical protein Sradi_3018200 [Sesamum radiatum]|uniref:Retroviral polymerase SH3-like domain-containing protein n=1 Tax=Sesamum radiatum TaxID=300843 RepID=A0AAW2S2C8_SESRA
MLLLRGHWAGIVSSINLTIHRIKEKYFIPNDYEVRIPRAFDRMHRPPQGFCSFSLLHLEAGLRFSLTRPMARILQGLEWGIGRGSVHNSSPTQVLQRSRRLSKDEIILRLGDGKAVAAEAVGSLRLIISNHIRIDLKGCYFVPNVYGPLSIPVRGGFSYFITFTDDYSRYGYVYLMRYKSETFGRFKECRLEVENQTNRKIKWTPPGTLQLNGVAERRSRTLLDMVRSMMSFTELPPSFWGYALETAAKLLNIAPSKSVPRTPYEIWHGKPASYKYLEVWGSPAYVKRLVGDKLDSRSSLCRFIEYPKETAGYYFYDLAEQKIFVSRNAVFLKKGFSSDNRRDEVLIEESSGEPHHDSTTSFEPTVHTNGVPVLYRSTRESRIPERYGFVGLTSQLDMIQRRTEKRCRTSIRISGLRP